LLVTFVGDSAIADDNILVNRASVTRCLSVAVRPSQSGLRWSI